MGYVGSDPWSDARPLFEGLQDRARKLGLACHLVRFKGRPGESAAAKAGRKRREFTAWLREVPKPLGLLTLGIAFASRYAYWAAQAGFRLPDELAVLSRSSTAEQCEACMPSFSSIDRDDERWVNTACDLLARMMAGEPPPRQPILIPPRGITERESTHLIAVPDRGVAAALRYLWDHLDQDLSVDDAARAAGVPRRQLERAFRRHLGRGISAELRRKRLEAFARLLRETRHSVADLAPLTGFRNLDHLYRSFHAAYGSTPRQYRLRQGSERDPSRSRQPPTPRLRSSSFPS